MHDGRPVIGAARFRGGDPQSAIPEGQRIVLRHPGNASLIGCQAQVRQGTGCRTRAVSIGVALDAEEHVVPKQSRFCVIGGHQVVAADNVVIIVLTGLQENEAPDEQDGRVIQ